MTQAPVNSMLLRMAGPISLGMTSTFLFQIVDTYFVGQLGSLELAALAFSATAYFLFISLFIRLSVGVSSVVAKTMGSGDRPRARALTMIALALVLVFTVALAWAGRSMIGPMFTGLGASADVIPLIETYLGILCLSFPFLTLGIVGSGAARAIGITKATEIVFGIAGIINLVLDYVLIFGKGPFPELGLAGAAWATAISFLFVFTGIMVILIRVGLLGRGAITDMFGGLRDILRISVPTIAMQILVPATAMFTTFLLAGYGSEVVAAFGVASRIETLALVGIFAVSMAITPFVAQNFGAGQHDRIDQAIVFAGKASIYMGILLLLVLAALGPAIAGIFSDDPAVIEFVGFCFKVVAVSYGFQGIVQVTVAIFNGLQMPMTALKLMGIRTFVIVAPLLFVGSLLGPVWVLAGLAAGNILAAIYAGRQMRKSERKWNRPIANANPLADIWQDAKSAITRIARVKN